MHHIKVSINHLSTTFVLNYFSTKNIRIATKVVNKITQKITKNYKKIQKITKNYKKLQKTTGKFIKNTKYYITLLNLLTNNCKNYKIIVQNFCTQHLNLLMPI